MQSILFIFCLGCLEENVHLSYLNKGWNADEPVMEEVSFLWYHCFQMWPNDKVSTCEKKNKTQNRTHIFWKWSVSREMSCGGESPFVETSNINLQRESSVGEKNQFLKV